VVVTWNWLDDAAGSGIDTSDCVASSTSSGEGKPITLSATCRDLAGNIVSASYDVNVDKRAPVITVPGSLYDVDASGPDGAVVEYPVTVIDVVDPAPTLMCSPEPGSLFPLLFTAVNCTASDGAGHTANATFDVLVKHADWQLFDTMNLVESWNLEKLGSSLIDKLRTARKFNDAGKLKQANDTLNGLLNQVASQSDKGLTTEQANELLARVMRIQHVIGY